MKIDRRTPVVAALLAVLVLAAAPALADVRLPAMFSDGMVLQRGMNVPVWGRAAGGEKVTVRLAGQEVATAADANGRWEVELKPLQAGGPLTMTVDGNNTVEVKDVLVGDVWYTAGQSNMMMSLDKAEGGSEFAPRLAKCANLRVLQVPYEGDGNEAKDDIPGARWQRPGEGYSAVSAFFAAKLYEHFDGNVPVGMITAVRIMPAEAWVDANLIAERPYLRHLPQHPVHAASKCFNGSIAPVAPYALRGALYYQGEYNGGRDLEFRGLMPAVIESWRQAWRRADLPFLFVQLPNFIEHRAGADAKLDMDPRTLAAMKTPGLAGGWMGLREAQLMTWQSVPNTGMAVTIDVGEPWDIHPKKKEPVADRLLLLARAVAYGEKVECSGPVPKAARFADGRCVVTFDHVGAGLVVKESNTAAFELAGEDMQWRQAAATVDGNRLVIAAKDVPDPAHVRYAWAPDPPAVLFNADGLPGTPFRILDANRTRMAPEATIPVRNGSFEDADANGDPIPWTLRNAQRTDERAAAGKWSIKLPAKESGIALKVFAYGAGHLWNCDPLREFAVRPGCLVGYSVQAALGSGGHVSGPYLNLCCDDTAGGYLMYGLPTVKLKDADFHKIAVVHRLTDAYGDAGWAGDTIGGRFLNPDANETIYLDDFSDLAIVRPLLEISSTKPIDLGAVKPGAPAVSEERQIRNAQKRTLPRQLSPDAPVEQVATVLYGCASMKPDGRRFIQRLGVKTDHVGAILIGPDANSFAFVAADTDANHASSGVDGANPRELKLTGPDGKGGLVGGENPQALSFQVKFLGADKPGVYQAVVRIVTQAGNVGRLSQGGDGEPPLNLFYVDIPVTARVGG